MTVTDRQLTSIAAASAALLFYIVWKGASVALTPLNLLGVLLVLTGAAMWAWAAKTLGRHLSPEVEPKSPTLITKGPFGIVRHPIYCGATLLFIGLTVMGRDLRAFLPLIIIIFVEIEKARREEEALAKRFSDFEYYRRKVGFFIPRR